MFIPGTVLIKLQICPSDLDELLAIAKRKRSWVSIVKKFMKKEVYDDKRLMACFLIKSSTHEAVGRLAKELSAYSSIITNKGITQALHVLLSLEGGEDQLIHGDSDEATIKKIAALGLKCWSALVGLMDDTYPNIEAHSRVHIPRDHVLFFDHIVMHGGVSYEKKNHRLFFKVGHKKNEFPFNKGNDLQIA